MFRISTSSLRASLIGYVQRSVKVLRWESKGGKAGHIGPGDQSGKPGTK